MEENRKFEKVEGAIKDFLRGSNKENTRPLQFDANAAESKEEYERKVMHILDKGGFI